MRLGGWGFCHSWVENRYSSGLIWILVLILMGTQLLHIASAETNCLFIHWENNTVMLDGKYILELKYGNIKNPPPQPYEKIVLIRELIGDLRVQIGSEYFSLSPESLIIEPENPIERPTFKPVARGKRAKLSINCNDEGKNIGLSKSIWLSVK